MRLSTFAATFAILLSLSILVAASHACWTDRGSAGAEQPVEFTVTGSAVYVVTSSGADARVYKYSGTWSSYATLTSFTPQAVGTDGSDVFASGKVTAGCIAGVSPCARVKKVTSGVVSGQTFKVAEYGDDIGQHDALNFKRFVKSGSNVFLTATNGVVFQKGGTCGSDWCGAKITDGSDITGHSIRPALPVLFIGTASGKVYAVGANGGAAAPSINVQGTVPGGVAIVGIAPASEGEIYALRSDGKVFVSNDGLVNWRQVGTSPFPFGSAKDLIVVPDPTFFSLVSALYTVTGSTTYAFTTNSTAAETYTTGTPTGDVRLTQEGSTIWALGLGSRNLLNFNCDASPSVPNAGADISIPYGGNAVIDPSGGNGNGRGHALGTTWVYDFAPDVVFTTVQRDAEIPDRYDLINAKRSGTYTWRYFAWFLGFPALNLSDSLLLTVGAAPPGGPADLCAGVTCPLGQTCNPASGACEGGAGPAPGPDLCAGVTCGLGESCNPASGACEGGAGTDPGTTPGTTPGQTGGPSGGVPLGGSCSSNVQCADDAACQSGVCLQLSCVEGRIPVAHRCVTICSDNLDCEAGEACIEGVCRGLNCRAGETVADNECLAPSEIVQCGGQPHNKNRGVCCNNQWVAGETQCPAAIGGSGLEAVQRIFAPQGNLLPFVALALLIVIIAMAVAIYFLVIKKPPAQPPAGPSTTPTLPTA